MNINAKAIIIKLRIKIRTYNLIFISNKNMISVSILGTTFHM